MVSLPRFFAISAFLFTAQAYAQCVPLTASIQLEAAQAQAFSDESYAEALTQASLGQLAPYVWMRFNDEPVNASLCSLLSPTAQASDCGAPTPAADADGMFAPWQAEAYVVNGATQLFIASNVASGQGLNPGPLDTAVFDANGNVYRLNRQITVRSSKSYFVCGCGDLGGGAPPPRITEQRLFKIPRADAFKGDIDLAYTVDEVSIRYSRTEPDGRLCPFPP